MAEAVANRYRGRGVAVDDLHQAAYEGLVKAVHKFDPTVRPDLLTYAVPTIRGEVQRWFRDQSWMVRPPAPHPGDAVEGQPQHRDPRAGARPRAHRRRALQRPRLLGRGARRDRPGLRLLPAAVARPAGRRRPTGSRSATSSPAEDGEHGAAEARATLAPVVRRLSERDRRILYLRFFQDQSQQAIGEELGVTQMQVSRLLERIMRDLRLQLT